MADAQEKELISAFAAAWDEAAPAHLGGATSLSLLALREVGGDQMSGALAVAATWSSAFAAECSGAIPGVLLALFKSEDEVELDRLASKQTDASPKPGARAVVDATLSRAGELFAAKTAAQVAFSDVSYLDLSADDKRLAKIVGAAVWVGTFALGVGDSLQTQALLLYAPHGSLSASPTPAAQQQATNAVPANPTAAASSGAAPATDQPAAAAPQPSRRQTAPRRDENQPRNIERLLDVELDIVVRFGVTNVRLSEVVRMGSGSMIELNRAVDEPVELLVNGRLLARGEVVVVDGYYGVRVTEIGTPAERPISLL
ncbi:MAG: FliM/FliN family flagellar motor switch protein [Pyrinomonadaceae bacterium]